MEPRNTRNTLMDGCDGGVNLLTERVSGCALAVLRALGAGFLEIAYERALIHELGKDEIHRAQCLNYLQASGLHLCLLPNFGRPRLAHLAAVASSNAPSD